jgi:hypothetical protein
MFEFRHFEDFNSVLAIGRAPNCFDYSEPGCLVDFYLKLSPCYQNLRDRCVGSSSGIKGSSDRASKILI